MMNPLMKYEIPLNQGFIKRSFTELNKFTKVIQHMLNRPDRNQMSLSDTLGFRLLASINWSEMTLHEFQTYFNPFLSLKHLELDNVLSKIHCHHLTFKEDEVTDALYLWSDWRVRLNKSLADKVNENNEKVDLATFDDNVTNDTNCLIKKDNDLILLYGMSKWASDDSFLKFGTFLHYGIPRAKLRTPVEVEAEPIPQDSALNSANHMPQPNSEATFLSPQSIRSETDIHTISQFNNDSYNLSKTFASTLNISDKDVIGDISVVENRFSPMDKLSESDTNKHEFTHSTNDSGISESNSPYKIYYYRKKFVKKIDGPSRFNQLLARSSNGKIKYEKRRKLLANSMDESIVNLPKENMNKIGIKSNRLYQRNGHGENQTNAKKSACYDASLANLQGESEILETTKIVPKIVSVKGGLVTNLGNVYFPKK